MPQQVPDTPRVVPLTQIRTAASELHVPWTLTGKLVTRRRDANIQIIYFLDGIG
jgi:hypothetical protein